MNRRFTQIWRKSSNKTKIDCTIVHGFIWHLPIPSEMSNLEGELILIFFSRKILIKNDFSGYTCIICSRWHTHNEHIIFKKMSFFVCFYRVFMTESFDWNIVCFFKCSAIMESIINLFSVLRESHFLFIDNTVIHILDDRLSSFSIKRMSTLFCVLIQFSLVLYNFNDWHSVKLKWIKKKKSWNKCVNRSKMSSLYMFAVHPNWNKGFCCLKTCFFSRTKSF